MQSKEIRIFYRNPVMILYGMAMCLGLIGIIICLFLQAYYGVLILLLATLVQAALFLRSTKIPSISFYPDSMRILAMRRRVIQYKNIVEIIKCDSKVYFLIIKLNDSAREKISLPIELFSSENIEDVILLIEQYTGLRTTDPSEKNLNLNRV